MELVDTQPKRLLICPCTDNLETVLLFSFINHMLGVLITVALAMRF